MRRTGFFHRTSCPNCPGTKPGNTRRYANTGAQPGSQQTRQHHHRTGCSRHRTSGNKHQARNNSASACPRQRSDKASACCSCRRRNSSAHACLCCACHNGSSSRCACARGSARP